MKRKSSKPFNPSPARIEKMKRQIRQENEERIKCQQDEAEQSYREELAELLFDPQEAR